MVYKTLFTTWSKERGEYEKETTTPDILSGYTSCNMFFAKPLRLFAIGGNKENNFCDNWDIYADNEGTLYSIARKGSGASNSYYGDCNHIRNLMRKGYFRDTLTAYGAELMNA